VVSVTKVTAVIIYLYLIWLCNVSVQFQMKIRKTSRNRSRFLKYAQLSHLTLLLSRGQAQPLFYSLALLFGGVLVAVVAVVCLSSPLLIFNRTGLSRRLGPARKLLFSHHRHSDRASQRGSKEMPTVRWGPRQDHIGHGKSVHLWSSSQTEHNHIVRSMARTPP